MYQDLLKIPMDILENPKKSAENVRIFRDKSTDQFATIIFANKDKMYQYLDYTFHTIYSYLVTRVNKELMAQAALHPEMNIMPLCGDESIVFVFKGGSVMHILYNNYLDSIKSQVSSLTSDDMIKYFVGTQNVGILNYMGINSNNYLYNNSADDPEKRSKMYFQYDLENSKLLEAKSDSASTFIESILKPKFGISDIDYSIYINTNNATRYLLLHGIIVKLLHIILNYITVKFDNHLKKILNGDTSSEKPNEYIESEEIPNVYDHPYFSIVKVLKLIICNPSLKDDLVAYNGYAIPAHFNVKIQYNNRTDDINLKDRLVAVLNILNNDMAKSEYKKSMYYLYFAFDIVTYCEYLDSINPSFLNHSLDLNGIRKHIVKNITILVESKEYDLLSMPYYTLEELGTIKKNLAKIYSTLPPDASELKLKTGIQKGVNKVDTFKLINNTTITENDFEFKPTDCTEITINPTMPESEIQTQPCDKIHYISYNSTIRVEKGPTTVDFDLIRSKINLVMTGSHFIKNGNLLQSMALPSEFIDISIPRFDDTSNIEFLKNLKRTGGLPYLLNLKTSKGKNISINSYGPDNIAHDLLYVLYGVSDMFEPWLDAKFQKRIIRSVYFIVLTRTLKAKYTSDKNHLDNFLTFIDFCISAKNLTQNSNGEEFWNNLEKMVQSTPTITKQDSLAVIKYYAKNLELKNEASVKIFTEDVIGELISEKYHDVEDIIISLVFWSAVISKPNKDIIEYMNIGRDIYRYVPLKYNNDAELNVTITEIKTNLNKLLDTIINIGIKTYYLYNNLLGSGSIQNISGHMRENKAGAVGGSSRGGANNYIRDNDMRLKYLKYKKKYLDAKNQESKSGNNRRK